MLTAALLLNGCDIPTGKDDPLATEILRVEVEPNPVAVGDTAVFTCVIRDSSQSGFTFTWGLVNQNGFVTTVTTTDTNQYRWEAPSDTGRYSHSVRVNPPNGSAPDPVAENFEVVVTENN